MLAEKQVVWLGVLRGASAVCRVVETAAGKRKSQAAAKEAKEGKRAK